MRPALIVLAILVAASPAFGSPSAQLDRAKNLYRAKDCQQARKELKDLLYPKEQLTTTGELVDARVLLGVCQFELEPNKSLDTLVFSTGAVQLFDQTKADREAKKKRDEGRQQILTFLNNAHLYENNQRYLNFVGFGLGQFQNHERRKGIFFAASEGVTLATSVATWGYLVNKYGIHASISDQNEVDTVNWIERIEIGSGVLFLGLYAWGTIDSVLHYKPTTELKVDESLLPPELRNLKPKKTSFLDHLHLAPIIAPNSVGVGLAWEN